MAPGALHALHFTSLTMTSLDYSNRDDFYLCVGNGPGSTACIALHSAHNGFICGLSIALSSVPGNEWAHKGGKACSCIQALPVVWADSATTSLSACVL